MPAAPRAKSSSYRGVCKCKTNGKWLARWKGNSLGHHDDEEHASQVVEDHILGGCVRKPPRVLTSAFKGVALMKATNKWRAMWKKVVIGYYDTEHEANDRVVAFIDDGLLDVSRKKTSEHEGVSLQRDGKWRAYHKSVTLGYYDTENEAKEVFDEFIATGSWPGNLLVEPRKGISIQRDGKWIARWNGVNLGRYPSFEEAVVTLDNFIDRGERPEYNTSSKYKYVSLQNNGKWRANYKGTCLRYHDTEELAKVAVDKYLVTGEQPPNNTSSKYMFISWSQYSSGRWVARCGEKTKYMADEDDAARWYNSEAARLGRPLIEGVPDAPDDSLNEILKRHLV